MQQNPHDKAISGRLKLSSCAPDPGMQGRARQKRRPADPWDLMAPAPCRALSYRADNSGKLYRDDVLLACSSRR